MNSPKKNYDSFSKDSIINYAKKLEGYSLKELLNNPEFNDFGGKGRYGNLIEELYFGYSPNSKSEADFSFVGLELKTTPLKILKNGQKRCKERLVLNLINYKKIVFESFYSSSFWNKNKELLLVFYLHDSNKSQIEYLIDLVGTWDYPKKDLIIIHSDWKKIQTKVKQGKAHELSEGDTLYLGACTKGATAKSSLRVQPYSKIKAKQRAFSLKMKYLNIVYDKLKKNVEYKSIIDEKELEEKSFEAIILDKFISYLGVDVNEIENDLNISLNQKSKNYRSILTKYILGVKEKDVIEEFEKADIIIKTIKVDSNDKIKENLSFPAFKFKNIIESEWDDSEIKNLVEKKFLFVFFKFNSDGICKLTKVRFWNLSYSDLSEFEQVFNKTIQIIKSGTIIKKINPNGKVENNFPKSSESYLAHIRPHGANRLDTYDLPVKDKITGLDKFTKQSFWLNRNYLEQIYLN